MRFALTFILSLLFMASVQATEVTLTSDNSVRFNLEVDVATVNQVINQIQKMDANLESGYPIYLVLYTPGGSIDAGIQLMEFIKGINRPIHTVTIFAASMGFQFVQHLGTRYILNYGTLMSHKARGGFFGEFGGGYSQLDSRYGLWLRRLDMMDKVTVKRTNGKQTLKSYRSAYAPELWLNGPEAVVQGYADKVANIKCDTTLKGSEMISFRIPMARVVIKVEFAKCPIITTPLSVQASIYTNQGLMDLDEFIQKDGKFGASCVYTDLDYYVSNSSFYDKKRVTKTAQLCASDENLTLKKVDDLIKQKKDEFTRDLKQHVIYGY